MTGPASSQRTDLEKAVRSYGGFWDRERGMRTLREAGHAPQAKHTRAIMRGLARAGLLVKVQDHPVSYRAARSD